MTLLEWLLLFLSAVTLASKTLANQDERVCTVKNATNNNFDKILVRSITNNNECKPYENVSCYCKGDICNMADVPNSIKYDIEIYIEPSATSSTTATTESDTCSCNEMTGNPQVALALAVLAVVSGLLLAAAVVLITGLTWTCRKKKELQARLSSLNEPLAHQHNPQNNIPLTTHPHHPLSDYSSLEPAYDVVGKPNTDTMVTTTTSAFQDTFNNDHTYDVLDRDYQNHAKTNVRSTSTSNNRPAFSEGLHHEREYSFTSKTEMDRQETLLKNQTPLTEYMYKGLKLDTITQAQPYEEAYPKERKSTSTSNNYPAFTEGKRDYAVTLKTEMDSRETLLKNQTEYKGLEVETLTQTQSYEKAHPKERKMTREVSIQTTEEKKEPSPNDEDKINQNHVSEQSDKKELIKQQVLELVSDEEPTDHDYQTLDNVGISEKREDPDCTRKGDDEKN